MYWAVTRALGVPSINTPEYSKYSFTALTCQAMNYIRIKHLFSQSLAFCKLDILKDYAGVFFFQGFFLGISLYLKLKEKQFFYINISVVKKAASMEALVLYLSLKPAFLNEHPMKLSKFFNTETRTKFSHL